MAYRKSLPSSDVARWLRSFIDDVWLVFTPSFCGYNIGRVKLCGTPPSFTHGKVKFQIFCWNVFYKELSRNIKVCQPLLNENPKCFEQRRQWIFQSFRSCFTISAIQKFHCQTDGTTTLSSSRIFLWTMKTPCFAYYK